MSKPLIATKPIKTGLVPVKRLNNAGREFIVATVLGLMAAHLGVSLNGMDTSIKDYPGSYDNPKAYVPAWQKAITCVC